jgi:hypothetical protein
LHTRSISSGRDALVSGVPQDVVSRAKAKKTHPALNLTRDSTCNPLPV